MADKGQGSCELSLGSYIEENGNDTVGCRWGLTAKPMGVFDAADGGKDGVVLFGKGYCCVSSGEEYMKLVSGSDNAFSHIFPKSRGSFSPRRLEMLSCRNGKHQLHSHTACFLRLTH